MPCAISFKIHYINYVASIAKSLHCLYPKTAERVQCGCAWHFHQQMQLWRVASGHFSSERYLISNLIFILTTPQSVLPSLFVICDFTWKDISTSDELTLKHSEIRLIFNIWLRNWFWRWGSGMAACFQERFCEEYLRKEEQQKYNLSCIKNFTEYRV